MRKREGREGEGRSGIGRFVGDIVRSETVQNWSDFDQFLGFASDIVGGKLSHLVAIIFLFGSDISALACLQDSGGDSRRD